MAQQENLLQHYVQNQRIQKAIAQSIEDTFPIESDGKRLNINNIRIESKLNDWDFPKQRQFKMQRKSWHIPVYADLRITDASTGRLINKKLKAKIGNVPVLTNRFTMLIDGNEYQTINQLRRKSGVYSRVKRNGELESEFNLAKGFNFKMMLDPITQVFVLILSNRKYRL